MKCALFLMTEKGFSVLNALCKAGYATSISSVISSRDRAVKNDFYVSIKDLCNQFDIPFFDKNDSYTVNTEYCIAISWRWIIQMDKTKLIVLHDSLLPKYRGFAPLVNMLINGEKEIGVTALLADLEFDKGNIIAQQKINISYPIKIKKAIEKISLLYNSIVLELFPKIINSIEIDSIKQNESEASYSLWRDEEDYRIDWEKSSAEIKRFIDSVGYPYKGAFTYDHDFKVRILESELIPDVKIENRTPGKILFLLEEKPVVVCGSGLLKLVEMYYDDTSERYIQIKYRTKFK